MRQFGIALQPLRRLVVLVVFVPVEPGNLADHGRFFELRGSGTM